MGQCPTPSVVRSTPPPKSPRPPLSPRWKVGVVDYPSVPLPVQSLSDITEEKATPTQLSRPLPVLVWSRPTSPPSRLQVYVTPAVVVVAAVSHPSPLFTVTELPSSRSDQSSNPSTQRLNS